MHFLILSWSPYQRIAALIIYLEAIESRDLSRAEHRNLLISCYAKTKNEEKLKQLLEKCKSDSSHDQMDGAIEVLLRADFVEIALDFAKKFCYHEMAVQILTEYQKDSAQALDYLCQLPVETQLDHLRKFGPQFLKEHHEKTLEAMRNIGFQIILNVYKGYYKTVL